MKLLPFILVLFASPALAFPCAIKAVLSASSAASCSFSTTDADVFGESFEGSNSGYDNSGWTETVGGGTSDVDPDVSHPGTFDCTDKCGHALKIVYDGTNRANAESPTFSSTGTARTQFYMYVAAEGLSDMETVYVAAGRKSGTGSAWLVGLYQATGGQLQLTLLYYGSGGLTSYATHSNISTGTWYRIVVRHISENASNWYVNGVEVGAGYTAGAREIDFISFGYHEAATETATVYFDNLKVDDDTIPGACPE